MPLRTTALQEPYHSEYLLGSKCFFIVIGGGMEKKLVNKKQKPGIKPGLADRKPVSTGRTIIEDRIESLAK